MNFEEQSRLHLFYPLEGLKEGQFKFPVILETSDFFWVHDQSVMKSSLSFRSYFMKEMTHDEGREEMVNKYKMWTQQEFDKVFEAVGSHTGSYQLLWSVMKGRKLNLDESIQYVKEKSYDHLFVCIRGMNNIEFLESFLCTLKLNNYELEPPITTRH